MTRWEYLTDSIYFSQEALEADPNIDFRFINENYQLDSRGEEGWELVSVCYEPENKNYYETRIYFYKRPKSPEVDKAPALEI